MFIRRTLTRRTGGQGYHSYRLVPSERDGDKVRQRTLLNLGSDFDLPKEAWPELCRRIDESNRTASAATLKRILGGRQRVTVTFKRTDGRTLHVHKATRPEPQQKAILDALGIASSAGGTHTAVV